MKKNIVSIALSIALLIFSASLIFVGNQMSAVASLNARTNDIALTSNLQRTTWKVLDDSMTDLLDDGWKIIAQSSYRVVLGYSFYTGYSEARQDDNSYDYTLQKSNKYVTCFLRNPNIEKGTSSGCRALN
jgi:hypothetical protein